MSVLRLLRRARGLLLVLALAYLPTAGRADFFEPERPVDPNDPYCCAAGTCCLPIPRDAADGGAHEMARFQEPDIRPVDLTEALVGAIQHIAPTIDCPNPLGLPALAHAELCSPAVKASIRSCAAAAKAMLAYRLTDPNEGFSSTNYSSDFMKIIVDAPDHVSALRLLAEYRDALVDYIDLCLKPLDEGAFAAGDLDRVKARVGALVNHFRPGFVCTAVSHQGYLLTARHCVLERTGAALAPDFGALIFTSIDGRKVDGFRRADLISTAHYAGARADAYDPVRNGDDVVALKLPASVDFGSEFATGPAALGGRLVSIGYNANIRAMDKIAQIVEQPRPDRERIEHYRSDRGQMCRALVKKGGCLLHACQTESQMSGSPIFSLTADGRLRLSAIQVARIDQLAGMSCFAGAASARIPNAGADIANLRWP